MLQIAGGLGAASVAGATALSLRDGSGLAAGPAGAATGTGLAAATRAAAARKGFAHPGLLHTQADFDAWVKQQAQGGNE